MLGNYDTIGCSKVAPEVNIELTKSRWLKAKHDLDEAKYIEQLVFSDYVRTIRQNLTTWDYRIPMIKAAQSEFDKKKKKERTNLTYIENSIKEDFFSDFTDRDKALKLTAILSGGYESYYWSLQFTLYGAEYYIQIPAREQLTTKNIEYANEGKFVFLKRESSCCVAVKASAWTAEDLAKKIKEYINGHETDTATL